MRTRWMLGMSLLLLCPAPALADRIVYVNAALATGANDGTSWENAHRGRLGVQAALNASQSGDEIWVSSGTYAPAAANGSRAASFDLRAGVALLGGFAGNETSRDQRDPVTRLTRLTGDLNSNGNSGTARLDNSFHVVTASGVDATAVLDGFTVTGGVSSDNGTLEERSGAGVLIRAGATPVVRRCVFTANTAGWRGGDLAVYDAAPLIESCIFSGTSTARWGLAMAHIGNSAATVRDCQFLGAPATTGGMAGIGIYTETTSAAGITVEGCRFSIVTVNFTCPAGVGMYVAENSRATVRDSRFINNKTCGGGGGIHCDGIGTVDRCVFIGNEGEADGGAALFCFEGETTVTNSLFSGNDREGFSTIAIHSVMHFANCTFASNGNTNAFHTVINTSQAGSTFANCIFWDNRGNTANVVLATPNSVPRPSFNSCLVQSWNSSFPGMNSFAANPMFVNMTGTDGIAGTVDDDLRLRPGSPAIDRGNNSLLDAAVLLDLDDATRRRDDPTTADLGIGGAPIVDLGPYEFQPECAADFNHDDVLNSQDFFDFLSAFFATSAPADFNDDGAVNSQDFFDYVEALFSGC